MLNMLLNLMLNLMLSVMVNLMLEFLLRLMLKIVFGAGVVLFCPCSVSCCGGAIPFSL